MSFTSIKLSGHYLIRKSSCLPAFLIRNMTRMSERRKQIITGSELRRRKRIVFLSKRLRVYRSRGKGKERNKSWLAAKIIPYWKMSKVEFEYRKLLLASGRFKDSLEAAAERRGAVGICRRFKLRLKLYITWSRAVYTGWVRPSVSNV